MVLCQSRMNLSQCCLVTVCLVAIGSPAATSLAEQPGRSIEVAQTDDQQTTTAAPSNDSFRVLFQMLQWMASAGGLEGLIKPETMGMDSNVQIHDNESELLSNNDTRMFNGNSATANISFFSDIQLHVVFQVSEGKEMGGEDSESAALFRDLDQDGNAQITYREFKSIRRRGEIRKLRKKFRALVVVS